MNKLYMGIDSGHFSTKCIIIDEYNNIVINRSKNNQDSPLETTKTLLKEILKEIDLKKYTIASVGTTGYGRNLIGLLLNASVIKNEIESEIEGVLKFYPDAKKIISVGEKNSKVINIIKNNNYSCNPIYTSVPGEFLYDISKKLDLTNEKINNINMTKIKNIDFSKEYIIITYNDIYNKLKEGYTKEDIIVNLSKKAATDYLDEIDALTKTICIGGVFKNKIITNLLQNELKDNLIISKKEIFLGAYGVASLAKKSHKEKKFDYNVDSLSIKTHIKTCNKCQKNCQIVNIYKNNTLVDHWGNSCQLEI